MVLPLIFGALAPQLLTGMPALVASSIGAGLGGAIQSGDLETGLLTGLGAFAGGSLLGPLMGGAGGAGAAGADAATAAATTGAKAGTAAATAANPAMAQPGGLMSLMRGPAPGSTASILGTAPATGGMIPDAINFAKSGVGTGVGIGAMAGPALKGVLDMGKKDEGKSKYSGVASKEMKPLPRPVQTPGADYQPGVSPEFDYGIGRVPTAGQIIDFRDTGALRYSDGGLLRRYQQMMGPVKMAEGGIASLAEIDGEAAMPAAQPGNEKTIITEAVRAIKGQSDNPQVALAAFLQTYGEQALRDLVDQVQSGQLDETIQSSTGKLKGPGDGMEDMIPATIDGQQDVLLSDGEYVVPADVVSHLGNGSSEAGARVLDEMGARARQARTGTDQQPARVPKEEMLPA